LVGATYLGLATGLGAGGKTEALTTGFGDVMAEIGILITFGVVIGSLLTATNTLHRVLPRQQVRRPGGARRSLPARVRCTSRTSSMPSTEGGIRQDTPFRRTPLPPTQSHSDHRLLHAPTRTSRSPLVR
jgi:hypothetical protein